MAITAKPLIDAKYASTALTTEYTCPASTKTIIDKFTATNIDASSHTLNVYIVPSGGAASDANRVVKDQTITAGQCYNFSSEIQNQILTTGDTLQISASTASNINIRCSGREIA